ncbi:hypothetical protein CXG81DRAFT_26775 [Caulochytrium protostelioides]|uniref:Chromosome segregation in meiosis protein n=1 Tax=Caulochytrium protostelioides TaxID=1555241 RepID=A0A4P9X685_9FUNG|nr:hypothetical protein CXG81DRAFT_26775 [Caulochytrium protostelioides]|eukprot:RKP00501.1 hypothetical protein CXG81DRAFT_26775 [Caulochytrium protostelioides]
MMGLHEMSMDEMALLAEAEAEAAYAEAEADAQADAQDAALAEAEAHFRDGAVRPNPASGSAAPSAPGAPAPLLRSGPAVDVSTADLDLEQFFDPARSQPASRRTTLTPSTAAASRRASIAPSTPGGAMPPPRPPPRGSDDPAEARRIVGPPSLPDDVLVVPEPSQAEAAPKPKKQRLDLELLLSERGMPALVRLSRRFRAKGRGREPESLARLLRLYQLWGHALFPSLQFGSLGRAVERLTSAQIARRYLESVVREGDLARQEAVEAEAHAAAGGAAAGGAVMGDIDRPPRHIDRPTHPSDGESGDDRPPWRHAAPADAAPVSAEHAAALERLRAYRQAEAAQAAEAQAAGAGASTASPARTSSLATPVGGGPSSVSQTSSSPPLPSQSRDVEGPTLHVPAAEDTGLLDDLEEAEAEAAIQPALADDPETAARQHTALTSLFDDE